MDEYVWPHIGPEAAEKIQEAWPVTCQVLPVGKRITATVIGRQPFGIFVRMHGVPDAVGLAEVVGMPRDFELPQLGAQVEGHVADHVERNHQVRITLDGWVPAWNGDLNVRVTDELPHDMRRYAHVEQEAHTGVTKVVETDRSEPGRVPDLAPASP